MCGIVAVVGSDVDYKVKNMFKDLLILDTIRGWHSTGVLSVSGGKVDTLKKAVDGVTFTDMKRFDRFMTRATNPRLLLGHNRAATAGRVNDANAHPFTDGDTHLVHNGTLKSYHGLHRSAETSVDSEAICFQVEESGLIDTVSQLDGAFTIASYDEDSEIFSVIRNSERPMWIAKVKDKDVTILASEWGFITAAASRNGIELKTSPWSLREQTLLDFHLDDKENVGGFYINKDIEFYEPPVIFQSWKNRRNNTGKKSQAVVPINSATKKSSTSTATTKTITGKDERLKKTSNRLRVVGLCLNQKIVGQVDSFEYFYKEAAKGKKGTGVANLTWFNPDDPEGTVTLTSYAIPYGEYLAAKNDFIYCKVVGVTDIKDKEDTMPVWSPIVVGGVSLTDKDHEEFWSLFNYDSEEADTESEDDEANINGRTCTVAQFKTRTKDGCCVCSNPIPVEDADVIVWGLGEPLCKSCTIEFAHRSKTTGYSIDELLTT